MLRVISDTNLRTSLINDKEHSLVTWMCKIFIHINIMNDLLYITNFYVDSDFYVISGIVYNLY